MGALALAWLASTRHRTSSVGGPGTGPANALGPDVQWPAIRGIRREVLASSPRSSRARRPTTLDTRAPGWRRPKRPAGKLSEAIDAVLREAEWLGVTGRGAISAPGRALVGIHRSARGAQAAPARDRPDEVAAAMSQHLPQPVDHILVQADLTAVAPGPLEGALASFMRLAAEIESRGGATVHRFTHDSIRRASMPAGPRPTCTDTVRRSSRTPVPQPLEYLVTDVARKHGADPGRRLSGIRPL